MHSDNNQLTQLKIQNPLKKPQNSESLESITKTYTISDDQSV